MANGAEQPMDLPTPEEVAANEAQEPEGQESKPKDQEPALQELDNLIHFGTPKGGKIDLSQGPGEAAEPDVDEPYDYGVDVSTLNEPDVKPGENLTGAAATARMEKGARNQEVADEAEKAAKNLADAVAAAGDSAVDTQTPRDGLSVKGDPKRKMDTPKGFGRG